MTFSVRTSEQRFSEREVPPGGLLSDTRGAVLLVGIVLGSLLVGGLFYLASVGDAILWRESAQDAADAVAFENAVWNARGMNVIVAVNIVMSMVLCVLVLWRLVMLAIAAAIGISAFLCLFGVGCGPAATLTTIEINMLRADPRVADTIIRILSGINVLEMGIASAVPIVGTAAGSLNTKLAYGDASSIGLSASLLPNVNATGIYNAMTCLASGDGKPGGAGGKPDAGTGKPGAGSGGGGGVDTNKPGGGNGSGSGVDMNKPGRGDPCDPSPGGSAPASRNRPGGAGSAAPAGSGAPPAGSSAPAGPAPQWLQDASQVQEFLSMRMGMPVSLPVQDGDYSLLCNKAAAFPLNNLAGALEKALQAAGLSETLANFAVFPLDLQRNLAGVAAELLTGVFCAPIGTSPVAVSAVLDKSFRALCEVDFEKNGKNKRAPGTGEGGSGDKAEPKYLDEDGVARSRTDWIKECSRKKKVDMNKELDGQLCAAEKALPEIDCGKPAQVWDFAANGSVFMRSFGATLKSVDSGATDRGLDLADAAQSGNVQAVDAGVIDAHAEMYFECEGKWGDCSRNAMWQLRWRARLRRVQPLEELLAASVESALAGALAQALKGVANLDFFDNLILKVPGTWTQASEIRPIAKMIEFLSDTVSKALSDVTEPMVALQGRIIDFVATGFNGPTTVQDLRGNLHMGEHPPGEREDELRKFIRQQESRRATIH